jgi:hypothetical protein
VWIVGYQGASQLHPHVANSNLTLDETWGGHKGTGDTPPPIGLSGTGSNTTLDYAEGSSEVLCIDESLDERLQDLEGYAICPRCETESAHNRTANRFLAKE